MVSSSGSSSGSGYSALTTTTTTFPNSGSEGDLHQNQQQQQQQQQKQNVIDQRKQKRMLSNRESARRSRMRKQQHLDNLMAQVAHLRSENNQILTTYKITTQQYLAFEAENSVLRTQLLELSSRLQSLLEIVNCMNGNNSSSNGFVCCDFIPTQAVDSFISPWNPVLLPVSNQPIISPGMLLS